MRKLHIDEPIKFIKKQLLAMKLTLQDYKNNTHDTNSCRLCKTSNVTEDVYHHDCKRCPWVWFTGKCCDEYYEDLPELNLNGAGVLSQMWSSADAKVIGKKVVKRLITNRKRQLKRQILRLEQYIKDKENENRSN